MYRITSIQLNCQVGSTNCQRTKKTIIQFVNGAKNIAYIVMFSSLGGYRISQMCLRDSFNICTKLIPVIGFMLF